MERIGEVNAPTGQDLAGPPKWANAFAVQAAVVLLLAIVSVGISGFAFGVGNNVFHIPIVLGLPNESAFTDDAFYQSLRHFASIVWPLLRLVSNEDNVRQVFLTAHFLSRAAAFTGILLLARQLGIGNLTGLSVVLAGTAVTTWMQGVSLVGGHGLFIGYFTHSETTWPFIFLFLAFLCKDSPVPSAVCAGITFSINAFVGVWLLLASLGYLLWRHAHDRNWTGRFVLAFVASASPVIVWLAQTYLNTSSSEGYSYIEYIRTYFPDHFLIEAATSKNLVAMTLVFANGLLATRYLPNAAPLVGIQLGLALLFLIGIPLPYLVDSRFVFNLHLIRLAGVAQAIAAVLVLIAGTRLVVRPGDYRIRLVGMTIVLGAAVSAMNFGSLLVVLFSLVSGMFIAREYWPTGMAPLASQIARRSGWLSAACVAALAINLIKGSEGTSLGAFEICAVLTVCIALVAVVRIREPWKVAGLASACLFVLAISESYKETTVTEAFGQAQPNSDWHALTDFIRHSHLPGPYLLPLTDDHSDSFQLEARKTVWIDWKQGAAAMWQPAFLGQWMTRYREVATLKSAEDYIAYAEHHGIAHIILRGDSCPPPARIVKPTRNYVLCQL